MADPEKNIPMPAKKSRANKTPLSLKAGKVVKKKSIKNVAIKKPISESAPPNTETSFSSKDDEPHGIARFFFKGCIIWDAVIPAGFIFLLLVYFLATWFFGLFTENNDSIYKLTVAFFGILGVTAGWFWRKTLMSTIIAAILGIIFALFIPSFLASLGPCIIGC